MVDNLLYEITRYRADAAETPIEQLQLSRDGTMLRRDGGAATGTVSDDDDPVAMIATEADFNEIRPDQITTVSAAPEIAELLPLILTAPGSPDGLDGSRTLYVHGNRWAAVRTPDGADRLLPADWATVAQDRSWLRITFVEAGGPACGHHAVELGLATPAVLVDVAQLDSRADGDQPTVRVWQRGRTPADDAQVIVSWLHHNALSAHLGVDADLLVYLFIETAVAGRQEPWVCDGELLATLASSAGYVGTSLSSQWRLTIRLPRAVIEAVLDAIADSGPQWRYAITAARDPESPAGRVRQTLLADLGR